MAVGQGEQHAGIFLGWGIGSYMQVTGHSMYVHHYNFVA
jgi:hypothetical protein